MSYRPRTVKGVALRDAILSALAEHGALNTTELAERIGWWPSGFADSYCGMCRAGHKGHEGHPPMRRVDSAVLQPTTTQMLRHGELDRWREHTSDIWVWQLGPAAPCSEVDPDELEALLTLP